MYAARNNSAQSPALVWLLLKGKADVNATDKVNACEGGGLGWYVYIWSDWEVGDGGVFAVGVGGDIDSPGSRLHSVGKGKGAVEVEVEGEGASEIE